MAASAMRSTEPPHTRTTGGPWPSRSNARVVPSFEVTVSIRISFPPSLREQLLEPGPPRRFGLGLVEAVDEDVVSDTDRTAEHADVHEPVDPVIGANTEEVPGEPVHLPIELREPLGREPDPVAELRGAGEPEPAIERRPRLVAIRDHRTTEHVHWRRLAAAEVREVDAQLVEVHRVALGQALVLALPVVTEEPAVDPADDGAPLVPPLDEVLERVERAVLTFRRAAREPCRRLPRRHRGLLRRAAEHHAGRTTLPWLDLVHPHEPGVNARSGGDRVPHLLGRGVDLDLVGQLERVCHLSAPLPRVVSSSVRRGGRPSGSGERPRSGGGHDLAPHLRRGTCSPAT